MKLINRIKQEILERLFKRPAVLNDAMIKALKDPKWVEKVARNRVMRRKLLNEMSQRPGAMQDLMNHPGIQAKLVRNPKFFDIMLSKTLRQPEALALALSQGGIRPLLTAQTNFTQSIAANDRYMQKILEAVPPANLPSVASALFKLHRQNIDVPTATVEEFAMSVLATANQPSEKKSKLLADLLVTHLGQSLPPLLMTLAERYPATLGKVLRRPEIRTAIIAATEVDIDPLHDMIRNFIITSDAAPTHTARVTLLMKRILADPAVKRAMIEDDNLHDLIVQSLDNALESKGSSLQEHLAQSHTVRAQTADPV